MVNKSGIYKITSPSGKVYIGQAVNLRSRYLRYKNPNCTKQQVRLKNSFLKYGFEAHQFDIIEYCPIEELNCSERFWQDEFDVLGNNGLNCILQECGQKRKVVSEYSIKKSLETKNKNNTLRKGSKNNKSKLTLSLTTGIYYSCLREACEALNLEYNTTRNKVNKNTSTDLVYAERFESVINIRKTRTSILQKSIVDTSTGKIYKSINIVTKTFGISYTSLSRMLKGEVKNKTNFLYLNDSLNIKYKQKDKKMYNAKTVLCLSNGIFYQSLREACDAMCLNYGTAQVYMRANKIKNLIYV